MIGDYCQEQGQIVEPFKAYVRLRPVLPREVEHIASKPSLLVPSSSQPKPKVKSIFKTEGNILFVADPVNRRKEKTFVFDGIFEENQANSVVFHRAMVPIVDNVLNGFNSTAMAYGVTGTGKTHTVFGDLGGSNLEKGIILYTSDYLFERASAIKDRAITVKMSYLEIYNETVIDLLNKKQTPLMIIEDSFNRIAVPDLREFEVKNSDELKALIIEGNARRTMGATNQNLFSSRSHAIIQLTLEQTAKSKEDERTISKLLVVDLAGSERGGLEKGIRREEGANINKSLFSLSNCINILSDRTKLGAFIPYRDSKLTRLLKDSLGGNIQTVLFACIGPTVLTYDESVNTLNYASRVRRIKKKVTRSVNEVIPQASQYKTIIDSLKLEISQLKDVIKSQEKKIKQDTPSRNKGGNNQMILIEDDKTHPSFDLHKIPQNKQPFSLYSTHTVVQQNSSKSASTHLFVLKAVDIDQYSSFLSEERRVERDSTSIDILHKQIDKLIKDKAAFEAFFESANQKEETLLNKYSNLKAYYEQYLELIHDKLIANIEACIMLKYNLKEINELNSSNFATIATLLRKVEESSDEDQKNCLKADIANLKKAIEDNNTIKRSIHKSFEANVLMKKELKKALLALLTASKGNEAHFAFLLKEKEELQQTTLTYEKRLLSILSEKNQKDEQLSLIQKEVERLQLELKQKDRTILELKTGFIKEECYSQLIRSKTPTPIERHLSNDSASKVQKIKYVINQTNNIVNPKYNKVKPRKLSTPNKTITKCTSNQPKTFSEMIRRAGASIKPKTFSVRTNGQMAHQRNGFINLNRFKVDMKNEASLTMSFDENLCFPNETLKEETNASLHHSDNIINTSFKDPHEAKSSIKSASLQQARLKNKINKINATKSNPYQAGLYSLQNAGNFIQIYDKLKESNNKLNRKVEEDCHYDTSDDKVNFESIDEGVTHQEVYPKPQLCNNMKDKNDDDCFSNDHFISIVKAIPNQTKLLRFINSNEKGYK